MKFFLFFLCLYPFASYSGQTGLFWTECSTKIQSEDELHVDFDAYCGGKKKKALGPNAGLNTGIFSYKDWKMEAGFDYLFTLSKPLFFNCKIGTHQNSFFTGSPSLSFGLYEVGSGGNDVVDCVIGKHCKWFGGTLYIGAYHMIRSFGAQKNGFMIGLERGFLKTEKKNEKPYDKLNICLDFATGKNSQGGGGIALSYNFSPYVSLQVGPVWFLDKKLYGRWKVAIFLDVYIPYCSLVGFK